MVDPRHPLYGRTLPLCGIIAKQYLGRCCVVWIQEGIERVVPLTATDRSDEPITIFPLPIDLSSVQQVLATFRRIESQPAEDAEDGSIHQTSKDHSATIAPPCESDDIRAPHTTGTDLAPVDSNATTDGVSGHGAGVSPPDVRGTHRRGGVR